jgi:hypothetical protein
VISPCKQKLNISSADQSLKHGKQIYSNFMEFEFTDVSAVKSYLQVMAVDGDIQRSLF